MKLYLIEALAAKRRLTFNLFLRLMGLVYFCAFFSLLFQIEGLLGDKGILPAALYLEGVKTNSGPLAWLLCPTFLWFGCNTQILFWLVGSGNIIAVALLLGLYPFLCTTLLYLLFLSIISVGQEFLSYQWDMLLLQAGFAAMIVALSQSAPASRLLRILVAFIIFWLDFRLMFSSGICKLASGDPTWANCTALLYHFSTEPLPTPLAILANAMPPVLSKIVCWCTLAIEIMVPFLIFGPRFIRLYAAMILAGLQIAIALTGNYCFFNLLSVVLLVPLFDDTALKRFLKLSPLFIARLKIDRRIHKLGSLFKSTANVPVHKLSIVCAAFGLLLSSIVIFDYAADFGGKLLYPFLPEPLLFVRGLSSSFGICNSYGLFAVMTVERPEIIIEGSDDGISYKQYQFPFKVSRPEQAPPVVAPHQPRLDWQMWFEGLNATYGEAFDPLKGLNPAVNPWFVRFMAKLSVNEPSVLKLLAYNPFAEHPAKYLRARVVNYTLVKPLDLLKTGRWWKTEDIGIYFDSKATGF